MKLPIIVGLSGASGSIYAITLLKIFKSLEQPTILIASDMGFYTAKIELGLSAKDIIALADTYYPNSNLAAPTASGSFLSQGMIIAPCSVKSLSSIANSCSDNLLTRTADVVLKERRKLVVLFRETPLHMGHINLMKTATENGAIIMPPVIAFYNNPQSIDDIVNHTVSKCLDLFQISNNLSPRWKG